jgi:hypothetical protein
MLVRVFLFFSYDSALCITRRTVSKRDATTPMQVITSAA